jgi:hypothetical protein
MKRLRLMGLVALATVALAPRGWSQEPAKNDKPAAAPPAAAAPTGASGVDLAKLRADYDRLRDELFRARARAALVEQGIYPSKFGARLRWKGAPSFVLRRAELRIDGNTVWDSGEKPLVDERIDVAERPIKPGTHTLTVRLEVRPGKKSDKETADLGYETEQTFVVNVPDHRRITAEITADDDGDLPEYEPELSLDLDSTKAE